MEIFFQDLEFQLLCANKHYLWEVVRYKTQLFAEMQCTIRESDGVFGVFFAKDYGRSANNIAESCYYFLMMAISNW